MYSEADLLIMFGHTSPTTPTVFASQRTLDHTVYTEIPLVKLPNVKKMGDDRSLVPSPAELGDVTGVFDDRINVEVCREGVEDCK